MPSFYRGKKKNRDHKTQPSHGRANLALPPEFPPQVCPESPEITGQPPTRVTALGQLSLSVRSGRGMADYHPPSSFWRLRFIKN